MTDQQRQKTAPVSLCCLRDTEEARCRVPLPHPLLPLWHEPFNLSVFHTKQYFHQTAWCALVVCIDVAINLLLPANRDLSQEIKQRAATLTHHRAEREHHIWYSQIRDVCFILQENHVGHEENMESSIKLRILQIQIVHLV